VSPDLEQYNKDFKDWLHPANGRSRNTALEGVGLTLRRFRRLIQSYEDMKLNRDEGGDKDQAKIVLTDNKTNEVRLLREQWEAYFQGPLFDRRLREITNPFPVRLPPGPLRKKASGEV
jgi:hypothetical protein